MNWKPASLVFEGGTEQARTLTGRRARARRAVQLFSLILDGEEMRLGPPLTLEAGEIAFVGYPRDTMIVLALPAVGKALPATLAALSKSVGFRTAAADWTEFRRCFDLEV